MSETLCLDSSVLVKLIVSEPGSEQAASLLTLETRLVAPAFAWAEVGSTLRKQVRSNVLGWEEAGRAWGDFLDLEVAFVETDEVMSRAWEIAAELNLPTLYDAAFLAVAETVPGGPCPFWTADRVLYEKAKDRGYPRLIGMN